MTRQEERLERERLERERLERERLERERLERERLIVQKVRTFAADPDLHRAALAKWFVEDGSPEAKQQAVIPAAIARWANYEPEIVLEIVYCLLEEINYHQSLATLKATVEGQEEDTP